MTPEDAYEGIDRDLRNWIASSRAGQDLPPEPTDEETARAASVVRANVAKGGGDDAAPRQKR